MLLPVQEQQLRLHEIHAEQLLEVTRSPNGRKIVSKHPYEYKVVTLDANTSEL